MLIFDTPGPAAKPGLLLQLCQLLSRALLARRILWWTFTCGHFQLLHAKIRDLVTSYHKPPPKMEASSRIEGRTSHWSRLRRLQWLLPPSILALSSLFVG